MKAPFKWMLTLAGCILVLAGCSGIHVSQDYSNRMAFTGFNTYDWGQSGAEAKADLKTDDPLVMERIQDALEKTLSGKGWTLDKGLPQCRIAYHYIVETKLSTSQSGPSFGIALGGVRGGTAMALGAGTEIEQYDEGQVVIDMLDGKTGKLVWRGKGTFRVASHLKPEKLTEKINMTVKKIMDQFPPKGYDKNQD